MGNFVFKLPDIGEGVVEGEIVQWHVSVGDTVAEDDPIVDVMTDKATVTIPSPVSGTIHSLSGGVGDMIAVGSTLLEINSEGSETNDSMENESEEIAIQSLSKLKFQQKLKYTENMEIRRFLSQVEHYAAVNGITSDSDKISITLACIG